MEIGTILVNLFSTDKDEVVYVTAQHNLSHTDSITLRRTLPKSAGQPLRTNLRAERGFPVVTAAGTVEKPVTVSIAITAPSGAVAADIKSYVEDILEQVAPTCGSLGTTGDIHLGS